MNNEKTARNCLLSVVRSLKSNLNSKAHNLLNF